MEEPSRSETSGDLLADRRYLRARELARENDHAAAADLLEQALELAPDWPAAWFALGRERATLQDEPAAVAAFQRAARLDPADRFGGKLALAALGAGAVPDAASAAYVTRLFDEYAGRFEKHLLETLDYRGPMLLRMALDTIAPSPRRFATALDLGCGTGLVGATLRDRIDHLAGVDMSPGMVAQAAGKHLYDDLRVCDLSAALAESRACDLVLAADVLIYIGQLPAVFALVCAALAEGGLFAFTLESLPEGQGVRVGPGLRFAHAPDYVRRCAVEAGLRITWWDATPTRVDAGADVPSLVVILAREDEAV